MRRLSDSAYRLKGQEMFKILEEARALERGGRDILHFELGDPHFETPDNVKAAAIEAINANDTHYAPSMGLPELRDAVAGRVEKDNGFRPSSDQVLISPSANVQIYYALSCAVNPGEEVVVPDPGFVSYFSIASHLGINAVPVPTYEDNEFRLNPDDVRKKITPNTRMIIINSPNNPTGAVMNSDEVGEVYRIAEENDLYVLTDEIYSKILYDGEKFSSPSVFDEAKDRTILINGFSKSYAMTGWRLGYTVGPEDLVQKMGLLLETNSSCTAPFVQRGGIEALTGSQSILEERVQEYETSRDLLVKGLNEIPGISCVTPKGAFYAFPNISKTGMSSRQFSSYVLQKAGVALAPGDLFGESGRGHVRLSYSTSKENISKAVDKMKYALDKR